MRVIDEEMETIHLYVVREEEKRPYTVFPILCACLCLVGIVAITLYSAQHPYYEHECLTVPATLLPLKVFRAEAPIIPTGVKTYPATAAHGMLTITNGSVVSQELPAGLIFTSDQGTEVATDSSVFVPAGSAAGFGAASVSAHSLMSGTRVILLPLAIDAVYGTSLYIRNLEPFTGGRDAYTVRFVRQQDRLKAIDQARASLAQAIVGLHYPCKEFLRTSVKITITWRCQFVTYRVPPYMQVTRVVIQGKNLLVDVMFIARPERMRVR